MSRFFDERKEGGREPPMPRSAGFPGAISLNALD